MFDIRELFLTTCRQYTCHTNFIVELYQEICAQYESDTRYYHNISHLEAILEELQPLKSEIADWNAIVLATFYHDVIYDASRNDNEEKSAGFAADHLSKLGCDNALIKKVELLILATKTHRPSEDNDTNIFTDADLSILGKESSIYQEYALNIRYEYLVYPGFLFGQGRIKVLEKMVESDFLFKTTHFRNKYEANARLNLNTEITQLKRARYKFLREDGRFIQYIEFEGIFYEFFWSCVRILEALNEVEKVDFKGGWWDNGYFYFKYKGVNLELGYDGMIGIYLETETNLSEQDKVKAEEVFEILLGVRLNSVELSRIKKYLRKDNIKPSREYK